MEIQRLQMKELCPSNTREVLERESIYQKGSYHVQVTKSESKYEFKSSFQICGYRKELASAVKRVSKAPRENASLLKCHRLIPLFALGIILLGNNHKILLQ